MKQHLTFFLVLISTLFVTSSAWADDPYLSQELTLRANETTTVYLTKTSSSPTVSFANLFLQYSTDEGETWETFSASTDASKRTIEAGSTMRLRRNPDNGINTSGLGVNSTSLADRRWYFVTTGNFSVEGNVMSLIDGENFATNTTIPAHCCFGYATHKSKLLLCVAAFFKQLCNSISYSCHGAFLFDLPKLFFR